jgi:CBS domain-containing protein
VAGVVPGAIGGFVATIPMTIAMGVMHRELPWWQRFRLPPREITGNLLGKAGVRHRVPREVESLAVAAGHFAYGTAAGALYGALLRRRRGLLSGALYGLLVWAGSYAGWLPAAGLAAPLRRRTDEHIALMVGAHVVWGSVLGMTARRIGNHRMKRKESDMARIVKDVMHEGVETARPEDTVKHAAILMEACEIGPVPVCDGQRLVGIVTDRDIAVRAVAAGRDPNATHVREVMTAEHIITCREDQPLDEVVELMRRHEVRRLPVLDAQRRLIGMVALADLAEYADSATRAAAVRAVSRPTETQQT